MSNDTSQLAIFDAEKLPGADFEGFNAYLSSLVQELRLSGVVIEKRLWDVLDEELSAARIVSSHALSHLNDVGEEGVMRIHGAFMKVPAFRPLIRKVAQHPLLPKWFEGQYRIEFVLLREPSLGYGFQSLHRDCLHSFTCCESQHLCALIAIDATNRQNGGTRIIPRAQTIDLTYDTVDQPRELFNSHSESLLNFAIQPGGVLWFTSCSPHGGTDNLTGERRRNLIVVFSKETGVRSRNLEGDHLGKYSQDDHSLFLGYRALVS